MKNMLLGALLVSTLTTGIMANEPCAPGLGGAYVGLGAGMSALKTKIEDHKASKAGFAVGPRLGYGWQMGSFYVGPEVEALFQTAKAKYEGSVSYTINGVTVASANASLENALKYTVSPSLRLGGVFGSSLLYAKLGVAFSKIETKLTINSRSSKGSKTYTGGVFGVGYEHGFTPNVLGFVETTYTAYRKKNVALTGDLGNRNGDVKPSVWNALVGLKYRFG